MLQHKRVAVILSSMPEANRRRKSADAPAPRNETIRRLIMERLECGELSARQLSGEIGIPEKEMYDHLEHIRTTMHRGQRKFVIIPPECRKCGFLFGNLGRLRKPGKCPRCKEESVHEPLYMVERRG